jgi:hypothetical protein
MQEEKKNIPAQGKRSRLESIEQRIKHLENQKKALQNRENQKRRKARTRQLIQIGALTLKYLNLPKDIEPADFEQVMKRVVAVLQARQPTEQKNTLS